MTTIATAETVYTQNRGNSVRWRFRYTTSNGEVHECNAWCPSSTDETTERTARGTALLAGLAESEAQRTLAGD